MTDTNTLTNHYCSQWGNNCVTARWTKGPVQQLPVGFHILVFGPNAHRKMWTYATVGMSLQPDSYPLELHLFSPVECESLVELLTVVAHFHLTGEYLNTGHTVNFGRPWLPGSICDHGLVSLPYLDGPPLEWLEQGSDRVRFLWLIPLTTPEVQFAKTNGLEALERRFDEAHFNYVDPKRKSVV